MENDVRFGAMETDFACYLSLGNWKLCGGLAWALIGDA
jgi:hypothetical protein